jgi:hypothetical protein
MGDARPLAVISDAVGPEVRARRRRLPGDLWPPAIHDCRHHAAELHVPEPRAALNNVPADVFAYQFTPSERAACQRNSVIA